MRETAGKRRIIDMSNTDKMSEKEWLLSRCRELGESIRNKEHASATLTDWRVGKICEIISMIEAGAAEAPVFKWGAVESIEDIAAGSGPAFSVIELKCGRLLEIGAEGVNAYGSRAAYEHGDKPFDSILFLDGSEPIACGRVRGQMVQIEADGKGQRAKITLRAGDSLEVRAE